MAADSLIAGEFFTTEIEDTELLTLFKSTGHQMWQR